jgi:formate-dependent nitrite reductase membrane component NrfD
MVMAWQRMTSNDDVARLKSLDRIAMIAEIVVLAIMLAIAGQYAVPLLRGWYGVLFLGGAVVLGLLVPLGMQWRRLKSTSADGVVLSSALILFGSAVLRIALVQAGQLQ